MKKLGIACIYVLLLSSYTSCKDEVITDNNVLWKNRICDNNLIYEKGLGYPLYDNTVVFHATPLGANNVENTIIYGLDTETGKEKWRLTNLDFSPKKVLQLDNVDYYYQNEKVVIGGDFQYKNFGTETYLYAIDIEKGKVLWLKNFPTKGLQFGRMITGNGKYAYVDFQKDNTEFSLFKINIETGDLAEICKFTQANIPQSIAEKSVSFDQMSQIYTDKMGNEYVAFSISGYNYEKDRYKAYMTLCVYSITENKILFSKYLNNQTLGKDEWDEFYGRLVYSNGKLFVGKGHSFYCLDAYEDKGILWQYNTGNFGNDNALQVFEVDNILLGYTVDRLFAFDINGKKLYEVAAGGSNDASVIDGIIYQRDGSDLQMRDPRTGRELKRVATPANEEAFSSSRPNGADGKIFIHSYTHAYCIKAWGK